MAKDSVTRGRTSVRAQNRYLIICILDNKYYCVTRYKDNFALYTSCATWKLRAPQVYIKFVRKNLQKALNKKVQVFLLRKSIAHRYVDKLENSKRLPYLNLGSIKMDTRTLAEYTYQELVQDIKNKRIELGKTLEEIASNIEVSVEQYKDFESIKRANLSTTQFFQVLSELDMNITVE